jgi:DNA-directed RNA polymerase
MAKDPIKYCAWMTADKPWQALACIFEIEQARRTGMSSLPVSVDGSNSGLQHFSAMLRDELGAKLVNLGPSLAPSDIYEDVAKWVKIALDDTLRSGDTPEDDHLGWIGKVDRKLCKRGTMTPVHRQDDLEGYPSEHYGCSRSHGLAEASGRWSQ